MRAFASKQTPAQETKSTGFTNFGRQVSPQLTATSRLQRTCACGGGCPDCLDKHDRSFAIQKKSLEISSPADADEREADDIARKVVDAQPATIRETGAAVNRRGAGPAETSSEFHSALESSKGGGRSLDNSTRSEMESKMGGDLGGVRIHTGGAAHQMNEDVSAKAFTHGQDIFFRQGEFDTNSRQGKELLAHELVHTVQQTHGSNTGEPSRQISSPQVIHRQASDVAKTEREKIDAALKSKDSDDVHAIKNINEATDREKIKLIGILVDQWWVGPFDEWKIEAIWTSFGARLPEIAAAEAVLWEQCREAGASIKKWAEAVEPERVKLESDTSKTSGISLGQLGSRFAKMKDMAHDLSVLKTGTGLYEGNEHFPATAGVKRSDCISFVMEVFEDTFNKLNRQAEWAKIEKLYVVNREKHRSSLVGGTGLDLQNALQKFGWKGIYWSPDPAYQIPREELGGHTLNPKKGIQSSEASYNLAMTKKKHPYYDKEGSSKVSVSYFVTNYAPEMPNEPRKAGYPGPSSTKKDTTQLDKLKKLPLGVLTTHGGFHTTLISYGKVIELHNTVCATSFNPIQQTDLEDWQIGKESGYHYYASGVIVAPGKDVDEAFK
ncbi:MAG TPA: DUF4157 domain-containing protein [Pyrinomonadaceae bacterium]|jgi:hypothetical protein|nr:DUF4157 domain-containing protein [Pyrinomonadaceae bacterium]